MAEEEGPHSVPPSVPKESAQLAQSVREVFLMIKDFHDRGIEPAATEVAHKRWMESRRDGTPSS